MVKGYKCEFCSNFSENKEEIIKHEKESCENKEYS